MEESFVMITADPNVLSNKNCNINLVLCDMIDAEYIGENKYKIGKMQNNMSERSRQIMGTTGARKTLKAGQDFFIKEGIYEKADDGGIIINAPKNIFVKIPRSTAKQLASSLSNQAIKLYIYLFNNYNIWNIGKNTPFLFSKSMLAEQALGIRPSGNSFKRIEDMLITLAQNGLITYYIVRKGKTYYRKLAYVSTKFRVHEQIEKNIKEVTQGLKEEVSFKDDKKSEELLGMIGLDSNEKVQVRSLSPAEGLMVRHLARETPSPFISVEESLRKMQQEYNHTEIKTKEDLVRWLSGKWSEGDNDKLIEYLEGS